jgi:MFS-type transporter involved in bile tolerance (Atg22 family)
MGIFSAWIGQLVDARCRKDSSGHLIFLPYGPRRAGYYLDSASDYQKIKALVGMYGLASTLFQVLGSTSAIVIVLGAISDHPGSLAHKLEFGLILYVTSAFAFQWLPTLLLWRLYKALLPELCSSLQEVSPESMGTLQTLPNPMRRGALIVAFACLLVMAVVLFLISRPQCMVTHSTAITQH